MKALVCLCLIPTLLFAILALTSIWNAHEPQQAVPDQYIAHVVMYMDDSAVGWIWRSELSMDYDRHLRINKDADWSRANLPNGGKVRVWREGEHICVDGLTLSLHSLTPSIRMRYDRTLPAQVCDYTVYFWGWP